MRLLDTSTLELHQFIGDCPEDYAILSHTWLDDECTFQDMSTPDVTNKKGWKKIKFCCEQAAKDGYKWAWVDTCCIDKKNNSELSEAINSMFRWYRNSKVCYTYLADVMDLSGFATSRWFTRGWTLQELIAPMDVRFYSSNWTYLGSKSDLSDIIQKSSGIEASVLSTGNFSHVSIATRMSWAANRKTTIIEDMSYSLMGIFEVNIPMIYGEGKNAFLRLQLEIMKISDDQSLFAWSAPEAFKDMRDFVVSKTVQKCGLFADSPADFLTGQDIRKVESRNNPPYVERYNGATRIEYPVCTRLGHEFILLGCAIPSNPRACLGIPVEAWGGSFHARCGPLVLISKEHWQQARIKRLIVKEVQFEPAVPFTGMFQLARVPNSTRQRDLDQFMLDELYCLDQAIYNPSEYTVAFSLEQPGPHVVLFFTSSNVLGSKKKSAKDNIANLKDFAIVLGYSEHPWTTFVPILGEAAGAGAGPNADFQQFLQKTGQMNSICMTKTKLKDVLSRGEIDVLPPRTGRFDQLLSVYASQGSKEPRIYTNLQISVDLDVGPVNLAEDGIIASIDIFEVTADQPALKPQTPLSMDYDNESTQERRQNYRPDWMLIEKLEWFKEPQKSDYQDFANPFNCCSDTKDSQGIPPTEREPTTSGSEDEQERTPIQQQKSIDDDCAGGGLSSLITENPIVTAGYAVANFLFPYLRNRK